MILKIFHMYDDVMISPYGGNDNIELDFDICYSKLFLTKMEGLIIEGRLTKFTCDKDEIIKMYKNNIEFDIYIGLYGVHINGCKFVDDLGSFEATSIEES